MRRRILSISFLFMLVALVACQQHGMPTDSDSSETDVVEPTVDPTEKPGSNNITFGRKNPSYYKPGVPMIEDAHIVYMNFDGFPYYAYERLVERFQKEGKIPSLKAVQDTGITFKGLRTTLPSITNPCQNMIITGATSEVTKNVYRYYDKATNTVIQQQRENANKTIVDVAQEANMKVASIKHFLFEEEMSPNDVNNLYIQPDPTDPLTKARGGEKANDHFSRFRQMTKLFTHQSLRSDSSTLVKVDHLPDFTAFYADDVDSIGHNFETHYGYKVATSEEERLHNVDVLLEDMDKAFTAFIDEAKKAGTYDKLTFFLTTDHGMTGYGMTDKDKNVGSQYLRTKAGEIQRLLKNFNAGYNLEIVKAGEKPKDNSTVVGVTANLNLQLTFRRGISDKKLEELKKELLKLDCVSHVLTRADLKKHAYWCHDTDMIISPSERYCFSGSPFNTYVARGQHDSMQESSNRIYGAIWGNGIKKGFEYTDTAFNYDFGTTMAAALGLVIPNANGVVLDVFDKK